MAEIALNKGCVAIIDDEDIPLVEGRKWYVHKSGGQLYAASKVRKDGRAQVTFLHRLVAGATRERLTFRNSNTLDCRKLNLKHEGNVPRRKSIETGAIGEAKVIADLTAHGHDVFIPVGGHSAADVVSIPPGGRPIRWQVKSRQMTKGTRSIRISLSAIQPSRDGYARRRYDLSKIDGFAIFCVEPEGVFYVPVNDIDQGRSAFSICMGPRSGDEGARDALDYLSPNFSSHFLPQ